MIVAFMHGWEPLAYAGSAIAAAGGGIRWLISRGERERRRRERRFDAVDETLGEHGERLSTIEGHLDVPKRIRARG